jgi:hypoxanthine phosphoribosyltransferase
MLPAEKLRERVEELAEEIDRFYNGREVTLIVVLRGAFVFAADLVRSLKIPVRIDFVQLQSYGDSTSSSKNVRICSNLCEPVQDREVLIVEDIVDSGHTIDFLQDYLYDLGAADVKVCTLLDKPSRREIEIDLDFVGFTISNIFVVGYGIDYAQQHRSLPDLCALPCGD